MVDAAAIIRQSWADAWRSSRPGRPGREHLTAAIEWLCRAQDATGDGGVAAWYSLVSGWAPSYIETTGYIIQTFLAAAEYFGDETLAERALVMADFLVEMRHSSGGLRTHPPTVKRRSSPTIFNTGQDLIGLADAAEYLDRYLRLRESRRPAVSSRRNSRLKRHHPRAKRRRSAYRRTLAGAAEFLCRVQRADGSWVRFTFGGVSHSYHSRVALGLLRAWQVLGKEKYRRQAVKQLDWARSHQLDNGWFSRAELPPPNPPLPYTHTIAYVVEGLLWSGLILEDEQLIEAARRTAQPVRDYFLRHDKLPATFDAEWQSGDSYSCLTGNAQFAVIWWQLGETTGEAKYRQAARRLTGQLKSSQDLVTGNLSVNGAIPGSFPVYGDLARNAGYCRLAYLNWATKFFADALLFCETQSASRSLPLLGMTGWRSGTRQ
ncbi:MAG: hypothetical protein COU69_00015 [Candidatus Pacebacteria bacterium CG10_big_fil_rev_8_21_14_0_10_56_10]|nr:MAG: hypothetical protein COU69_00015 [Candidatus Pacebacteria bacterium CG10_big_fil_rev_8_21_14_0_10_56_10]